MNMKWKRVAVRGMCQTHFSDASPNGRHFVLLLEAVRVQTHLVGVGVVGTFCQTMDMFKSDGWINWMKNLILYESDSIQYAFQYS